jgi:hypothetical protein
VLRSIATFINGLTAGAVVSQSSWPADKQIEQLRLHLQMLRAGVGLSATATGERLRKPSKSSASSPPAA